ncbi:hypothetical protein JTE90_014229 [Oedothorax gibbosus]|uniref:UvrD-like helicase C-terminal domain-containing protein n=1 Tax=Oedothorax gibbosus TaxID=931172 RepID=A0AAV6TRE3_9ARAC|nr:hypothetical protein JTE90_014229 [Oedothorax gibbosus]
MKREGIPNSWTPIEPVCRQLSTGKRAPYQVVRRQFPIVPAEAITIHKSQGSTYSQVSLHAHLEDLISDQDILSFADVIATVENWSLYKDKFNIPGFECIQRTDGKPPRTPMGITTFKKNWTDGSFF